MDVPFARRRSTAWSRVPLAGVSQTNGLDGTEVTQSLLGKRGRVKNHGVAEAFSVARRRLAWWYFPGSEKIMVAAADMPYGDSPPFDRAGGFFLPSVEKLTIVHLAELFLKGDQERVALGRIGQESPANIERGLADGPGCNEKGFLFCERLRGQQQIFLIRHECNAFFARVYEFF